MNYDLIVIGAGPGGAITAATVAQAGYRVLVLEKKHIMQLTLCRIYQQYHQH
ncbi:MAG: Dehydrogenase (flavoprotein) [Candidatus Methanomarinus sp.]|nr:MAG: Dehydrogenase (flavoprotein) [ANME-2 cluster archaeon]